MKVFCINCKHHAIIDVMVCCHPNLKNVGQINVTMHREMGNAFQTSMWGDTPHCGNKGAWYEEGTAVRYKYCPDIRCNGLIELDGSDVCSICKK
jgi:hypothetical protein